MNKTQHINNTSTSEIISLKSKSQNRKNSSQHPSDSYDPSRSTSQLKSIVKIKDRKRTNGKTSVTADERIKSQQVNVEAFCINNQNQFTDDPIMSIDKVENDDFIQTDDNDGSDPEDKFIKKQTEIEERANGYPNQAPSAIFDREQRNITANNIQTVNNNGNPSSFMNQYLPLNDDVKKHLTREGRIQSAHYTTQNQIGFHTINTNSGYNLNQSALRNQRQESYALMMFKGSDQGNSNFQRRPKNSKFLRQINRGFKSNKASKQEATGSFASGSLKHKTTLSNAEFQPQTLGSMMEQFQKSEGRQNIRTIYGNSNIIKAQSNARKSSNLPQVQANRNQYVISNKRSMSGGSPKKNNMSTIKFENLENQNLTPIDQVDIFMEQYDVKDQMLMKERPNRIQSAKIQSRMFLQKQYKDPSETTNEVIVSRSPDGANSRKYKAQWNMDSKTNHSSFKDVSDKDMQSLDKLNELKQENVRYKTEVSMLRKDQKRYEEIIQKVIDPQTWQSQEEILNTNQSKEDLVKAFQKQNNLAQINFQLMNQFKNDNMKLIAENESLENQVNFLKKKSSHTKFVELEAEKTQLIVHCQQQQEMIDNFRVYCKDITKNGNSATKPPDQKSDLNEILETQNKKIQQLQSLLHQEKTKCNQLKSQIQEIQQEPVSQKEFKSRGLSPMKELSQESEENLTKMELLESRQNIERLKIDNQSLQKKIEDLSIEVQSLKESNLSLKSSNSNEKTTKNSASNKETQIKLKKLTDQSNLDKQQIKSLQKQIQESNQSIQKLESEKQQQLVQHEQEFKEMGKNMQLLEKLQKDFYMLKQQSQLINNENDALRAKVENKTLSPMSNTSISHEEIQNLDIKFDNLELDQDSEDIQNQIKKMKLKQDQKEQIQKLVQSLLLKFSKVNQQYNQEISQLKQDAQVFQDSLGQLEEFERTQKQRIDQESNLEDQNQQLQAQIERSRVLQQQIDEISKEKEEIIEVIQKYESIVSDYETQISKCKQDSAEQINIIKTKLDEQIEINKNLEQPSSHQQSASEASAMMSPNSDKKMPKSILRKISGQMNTKTISETNKIHIQKNIELEAEVKSLKQQIETLKQQMSNQDENQRKVESNRKVTNKDMQSKIDNLTQKLEIQIQENKQQELYNISNVKKYQNEIEEKISTLEGLNETNDKLNEQLQQLTQERNSQNQNLDEQMKQIKDLQKALSVLQIEKETLFQQVVDAQSKLNAVPVKQFKNQRVQTSQEDKTKRVKFEDDSKVQLLENQIKQQQSQLQLTNMKNELIAKECEDILNQLQIKNQTISVLESKVSNTDQNVEQQNVKLQDLNHQLEQQLSQLKNQTKESDKNCVKLADAILNLEQEINKYEEIVKESQVFGEEQLQELKDIYPDEKQQQNDQQKIVKFEEDEPQTKEQEVDASLKMQQQTVDKVQNHLQSLLSEKKEYGIKLQEIDSQFYLLKQTIGVDNLNEEQKAKYEQSQQEMNLKIQEIQSKIDPVENELQEKQQHLKIMKALRRQSVEKNFEQITLILYREKLIKFILVQQDKIQSLQNLNEQQKDQCLSLQEELETKQSELAAFKEENVQKSIEVEDNKAKAQTETEQESTKQVQELQNDKLKERYEMSMEQLIQSHNKVEQQLEQQIEQLKLENQQTQKVKDQKIIQYEQQIQQLQVLSLQITSESANVEGKSASTAKKSQRKMQEPTEEQSYYDEEYESEVASQAQVEQKNSKSPTSVKDINMVQEFQDISEIKTNKNQDVSNEQEAIMFQDQNNISQANKGLIDFIEADLQSPSPKHLKKLKEAKSKPERYPRLLKKYQQRVSKVQQTKKPLTWLEIYQNFVLYIEEIEDLSKMAEQSSPTTSQEVMKLLDNSLISAENLGMVTQILRIADETHPLDEDFLSVYKYSFQYGNSSNKVMDDLICVKKLIKDLFRSV